MAEIKIKSKVVKSTRRVFIDLPQVWCDDVALKYGDVLTISRDERDRIIVAKKAD